MSLKRLILLPAEKKISCPRSLTVDDTFQFSFSLQRLNRSVQALDFLSRFSLCLRSEKWERGLNGKERAKREMLTDTSRVEEIRL